VSGRTTWPNSPIRRVVDVALAAVAGLVLSPVIAVVAILARRAHGSPIMFRQQRAGIGARPIMVAKFRTMTNERGDNGELLPDEDRLTPLGRRLRASSLDELPQLWSVIIGDMSLIGPRPLPMTYVERYSPSQRRRLDARPGITGWAQVNGRNALSWPDKLALDVWYVENASPRLDAKILLRTIQSVLTRDGVSADGHATMPEFMGET
jgi:lipopolysaccharide/colanic/teichoic acid biosynthesis glycosyltransferase